MTKEFPKGFLWGAAASAQQLEGASSEAKKAKTVWDYWYAKEPDKFYQKRGPEHTSNFYYRYKEDIVLMKNVGFNSFRTSISWARLIPDGKKVNKEAVSFYRDLFERLNKEGIKPIANLFHFDMPLRLHKIGGWENKEVLEEFYYYAKVAFETFGDLVFDWVTFNEPIVPIEMGYLNDKHLPGIWDMERAMQAGFNTMVAHKKAVKAFKEANIEGGKIGIILNLTPSYPKGENVEDIRAAEIADAFFNKSFLDPAVLGRYPRVIRDVLKTEGIKVNYSQEELDLIKNYKVDFLGVNYYQPRRVQKGDSKSNFKQGFEKYFRSYKWPKAKMNPHRGWEIYEKGIYDIAINLRDCYSNIPWFVAENGMGVEGEEKFIKNGMVMDDYRIEFMSEHLTWLHKAIQEGSNCFGYHVWTFIDNWSWLNEYKNRYGLYRVDLLNQKRTIKKSGRWFYNLATTNKLIENN
ncbi:glycoside hydrolase family 1 protein [Proteinivorax tanatarense]|uniref:Glycoside hydrolase family 1 protein n=1 Tax=Proteinivorax tanatarense TaxID=1260629 RepID=A0AAU7VJJ8_9FIRM